MFLLWTFAARQSHIIDALDPLANHGANWWMFTILSRFYKQLFCISKKFWLFKHNIRIASWFVRCKRITDWGGYQEIGCCRLHDVRSRFFFHKVRRRLSSLVKYIKWKYFSSLITFQIWHSSPCQDERPGLQKLCCRRSESSADIWLMNWKQNNQIKIYN